MQFKNFFLFVFQFHPFVYIVPLTYRLSYDTKKINFSAYLYTHRNHPLFLFWTLLAISSTFKAYPALGDFALPLSMLPLFHKILFRLTYLLDFAFILILIYIPIPRYCGSSDGSCGCIGSCSLANVDLHRYSYSSHQQKWISTLFLKGGGNANFYYAITLVFTLAQVLLISDAASSVVKLDYLKKHNIIRSADENKND